MFYFIYDWVCSILSSTHCLTHSLTQSFPFLFVVHGKWTPWGPYGPCSKTCGGGTQSRSRTCTNPAPAYGGKDCVGPKTELRKCNEKVRCPGKAIVQEELLVSKKMLNSFAKLLGCCVFFLLIWNIILLGNDLKHNMSFLFKYLWKQWEIINSEILLFIAKIGFKIASQTVNENAGTVQVEIVRTGGLAFTHTVRYWTKYTDLFLYTPQKIIFTLIFHYANYAK